VRTAFKEWAVIVDALGQGAQILILRKGGISEGGEGFRPGPSEFFLFPTLFHQQRESVLPSAQARYDQILPLHREAAAIRIESFARVADWRLLRERTDAERLRGQHVWRDEVVTQRFDWGRDKSIHALAVRVYRLPAPVILPSIPAYAGCKSWIELERELDLAGAVPVLDDVSFNLRLAAFQSALQSAVSPG
jgi:hypothetical protein